MLMGVSKVCITPQKPLKMCGFAFRTRSYDSVAEDIFVRVHFLQENDKRLIFVYGDLIAWAPDFVAIELEKINKKFSFNENEVFFVASHNHSGPPTGTYAIDMAAPPNKVYFNFLHEQVFKAVCEAIQNVEPVSLKRYNGECDLNVYRRRPEGLGATMRPNYDIKPDRTLTVVKFLRKDNSIKGLMINYACHANVCGLNILHPDYPGIALRMLDEKYDGCVSLFLQGFTGDLRPNCVLGNEFERMRFKGAVTYATRFAAACEKLLTGDGNLLEEGCMYSVRKKTNLQLENCKDSEYAQKLLKTGDALEKDWAKHVLRKNMQTHEVLNTGLANIAKGFAIFTMNAEVSQNYAANMRELMPEAVSAGYADGMIGYICTEEQIHHGGYEPHGSAVYLALNGTYPPSTENTILAAMKELCENLMQKINC